MDALAGLAPTAAAYARLPVAAAFTWDECVAAIPRGEWYMVAFRSILRTDADIDRLHAYDDLAHAEASGEPGFVHYFKGPLGEDGSCLSFCLWTSRAAARSAAGLPAHREAAVLASEMYQAYTLEFLSVRKARASARLEFSAYDRPADTSRPHPTPVLGASAAAS